jgi:cytoskeletal protein RodZ
MGISGDIRPKKVYHYDPNRSHESATQKTSRQEEDENENFDVPIKTEPAELSLEERDKLKDEFFTDQYTHDEKGYSPEPETKHHQHKKKSRFPTKIIVILLIALFLIVFAFKTYFPKICSYLYSGTTGNQSSEETSIYVSNPSSSSTSTGSGSTTTPTTTTTPNTTTPAAIDKSTISLEVLNGNGVSGSANIVTQTLTTAGFTVAKTTNAARYTYTKTYIYFKTGKDAEAALVAAALSSRQTTTEVSDTIAKSYDIVVVVGKN